MLRHPLRTRTKKAVASLPGSTRISFLTSAAQALADALPELTAHLNREAAKVAKKEGLQLNKAMSSSVCKQCGGALGAQPDADSATIAKLPHHYQRRKRQADDAQASAAKRHKPQNTVVLLQTCTVCGEAAARPFYTAEAAAQAAGDGGAAPKSKSKSGTYNASINACGAVPGGHEDVVVNQPVTGGTAGSGAAAGASVGQPSPAGGASADLSNGMPVPPHRVPAVSAGGGGSKTTSAVAGQARPENGACTPADSQQALDQTPAPAAAAAPMGTLEATFSFASQYAQQARPPAQPDLSTADNYNPLVVQQASRPQLSDSVVQPELSLVRQAVQGGGHGELSAISQPVVPGGSRAGSRGGSARVMTQTVGRTESVCSKYPRGLPQAAHSERMGEAPGSAGPPSHALSRAVRRSSRLVADTADDVMSIGTFASELSNKGRQQQGPAGLPRGGAVDDEHVTSPIRPGAPGRAPTVGSRQAGVASTAAIIHSPDAQADTAPSTAAAPAPATASQAGPLAAAGAGGGQGQGDSSAAANSGGGEGQGEEEGSAEQGVEAQGEALGEVVLTPSRRGGKGTPGRGARARKAGR